MRESAQGDSGKVLVRSGLGAVALQTGVLKVIVGKYWFGQVLVQLLCKRACFFFKSLLNT